MLKKLTGDIVVYGGTNAIKSLVPFLMLPILTLYLSISDYGILSIIETTILLLVPIVSLNISGAINVEYFKVKFERLREYVTNSLLLSFISFLIVFVFFVILSKEISLFLNIDEVIVLWLPVFAFLRVSTQVILGIFQVSQKAKKFAMFTILQTLVDFALSYILVVYLTQGYIGRLEGVYVAYALFSFFACALLFNMKLLSTPTMKHSKEILQFGLPLIPHVIGGTIMAMSDRYFISYYIGNSDVGLYSVAYQISSLMLLVSVSVNQAWTPLLFSLLKEKDKMRKIITYSIGLTVLFSVVGLAILFFKDMLFQVLVDEKFYQAKEFFMWLLIGFVFQSLYFLVTNFLFFEKKTALLAKITLLGAILNVILNYFFIQEYGTIGVAYATAITWFAYCISVSMIVVAHYKKRVVSI